jgi:hypothetical protein
VAGKEAILFLEYQRSSEPLAQKTHIEGGRPLERAGIALTVQSLSSRTYKSGMLCFSEGVSVPVAEFHDIERDCVRAKMLSQFSTATSVVFLAMIQKKYTIAFSFTNIIGTCLAIYLLISTIYSSILKV